MKTDRVSDFTAAMVQQRIQPSTTGDTDAGVSFRKALEEQSTVFQSTALQQGQTSVVGETTEKAGTVETAAGNSGDSLSFSKHAAARLDQRGISVSDGLMSDLEQAVSKAREKGSKEVAVIGSQGIFIVNVPNNVVVTTMSQDDMKDRILTNIDGAVIM
ncbi:MAG: TIGR02530 family flagellar biosynthesis protein [Bilifractor sp.]|jgi:flagellar operon protein